MEKDMIKYSVQVGAFRTQEAAMKFAQPLKTLGYPVKVIQRGQLYVVLVGEYSILAEATEAEGDLRSLGYQTIVKEYIEKELNY